MEFSLGHLWAHRHRHFAEHSAGIHPHIHLHDGHAGFLLSLQDGIMDGSRSPIPGQQRGMDIDAAEFRQFQQSFRKELAKSRHHNEFRLDFFHFCLEFRSFDPFRLQDRQTLGQGIFLHSAHHHLVAPAFGTVRLGHNSSDFILTRFHQGLQAGRGKFRSSHKYDFHAFSSFGLAERLIALSMNRIPSRWSHSCWSARARSPSAVSR